MLHRPPSSWSPIDLRALLDGESQHEQPTVLSRTDGQRLLYPGINSVCAEPEGLKTWLALEACRQELAAGRSALYVDFENTARSIVERLRALGVRDDELRERFMYVHPADPVCTGDLARLLEARPSVCVIDATTEAMVGEGLSTGSNDDAATFKQRVSAPLAREGAAVLVLDHVVKAKDERGRWSLGAAHKLAAVSGAAYTLDVVEPFGRGRTGRARLRVAKDRHGWIDCAGAGMNRLAAHLEANSDGERVTITLVPPRAGEAEAFRPTVLMERLSRAAEAQVVPVSGNALLAAVTGNRQAKLKALAVLVADGYLTPSPHRVLRPFRDEREEPGVESR